MKKRLGNLYRLLILVMTVFSLSSVQAQAADRAIDSEGNGYNTVSMGEKVWMRDNLDVSRYRNEMQSPMPKPGRRGLMPQQKDMVHGVIITMTPLTPKNMAGCTTGTRSTTPEESLRQAGIYQAALNGTAS